MTTIPNAGAAAIQNAEHLLREVLDAGLRDQATDAANSLERILVHVKNMQQALESNPGCRLNVVKRLRDFSATTAKMASNYPQSASGLTTLTETLKSAAATVADDTRTADGARADAA
jgi:hypothetical protein